jgi:hypothetical protein
MENHIEIQKRSKPAALIIAVLIIIGASALWAIISFAFPALAGFFKLKVAVIAVVVFLIGWAIYITIKQLRRTTPGLIIAEDGITDNSGIASIGFIPWNDIVEIKEETNLFKHKLIVLIVKNPDVYINKTGKMSEARKSCHKQFGSPIVINFNSLECDSQEIISILRNRTSTAPA